MYQKWKIPVLIVDKIIVASIVGKAKEKAIDQNKTIQAVNKFFPIDKPVAQA